MAYFLTISLSAGSASGKPLIKTYLAKEQILEQIQALPKKSKYLTREEIKQRMSLARELGLPPQGCSHTKVFYKERNVSCGTMTRKGTPCKKAPLMGGCAGKCLNHGGASLKGELHPRYKHGKCTLKARQRARDTKHQLRLISQIGNQLGMFLPMPRNRK